MFVNIFNFELEYGSRYVYVCRHIYMCIYTYTSKQNTSNCPWGAVATLGAFFLGTRMGSQLGGHDPNHPLVHNQLNVSVNNLAM